MENSNLCVISFVVFWPHELERQKQWSVTGCCPAAGFTWQSHCIWSIHSHAQQSTLASTALNRPIKGSLPIFYFSLHASGPDSQTTGKHFNVFICRWKLKYKYSQTFPYENISFWFQTTYTLWNDTITIMYIYCIDITHYRDWETCPLQRCQCVLVINRRHRKCWPTCTT